ncbi:hypothetical protein INT47_005589 [Mucor saturninus]|uniref:Transposase domain-containing protein n=1 Tax=Mucor saturninus TaxID=64648 RepID=A0A8H7UU17_9FUNG|nr:hypothetical protein INT47_005589 [Mucor saturninus]
MFESESMETMGGQANLPFLDSVPMSDDDLADNEVNGDDTEIANDSDNGNNEESDVEEIDVEEFNGEEPFGAPGMPENPVHRAIAIFVVLFASRYAVNKGAVVLIQFVNELLMVYGQDFQLPTSLAGLQKMTGFSNITKDIKRFVSCPDCHQIYEESISVPPLCSSVKIGANITCNCELRKKSTSGAMVPKKIFVYQSVKDALKVLFLRPGFEQKIGLWNDELKVADTMCDVYDGKMWKELKDSDGLSFVARPRSLLLTLNIDWFQPFDGVTHSSGAIYLAINNLPRDERFKPENVVLVGLMPGPKEPKSYEINSYLKPLVDDLEQLYVGMTIPTFEYRSGATVRAALLMVACDIPAARKTSGFTSHNSTNACYKCSRQFSRLAGTSSVDFRGFNYLEWSIRHGVENRVHAEVWKSASTPSERHQLEIENGVRWSQLHRLGYFDLVRGTIIDPMHNLFLGTAKRMMEKWIAGGDINSGQLNDMQQIAKKMTLPASYSSLTAKIGKGFSFMKADEWKSWVLAYSPVLLKDVLNNDKFRNWMDFVDACRLLVKPSLSFEELDDAHDYLEKFCQKCERLYPPSVLTCNMHLHLHLRETIRDFGPVYGYWLFGFERYNGLLKNVSTNRKDSFEATYMRNFVEESYKADYVQAVLGYSSKIPFSSVFAKLVSSPTLSPATVPDTQRRFNLQHFLDSSLNPEISVNGNEPLPSSAFPLQLGKTTSMGDVDYPHLLSYYREQYGIAELTSYQEASSRFSFVDDQITKLKSIDLLGQVYRGANGLGNHGSYIQALYVGSNDQTVNAYTGQIQYLFIHKFTPPSTSTNHWTRMVHENQHVFAFVRWFATTSNRSREDEGVEVCKNEYSMPDHNSILPVHRILLEVAIGEHITRTNKRMMLVIPLPKKICA